MKFKISKKKYKKIIGFSYINGFLLCFVLAYLFPYLPTWDGSRSEGASRRILGRPLRDDFGKPLEGPGPDTISVYLSRP